MSNLSTVVQQGAARFGVVLPKGLFRFLGVGMAGLATQTAVFTVLFRLGLDKSAAWLIGLAAATALTWALNRRFTFAATGRSRRGEMARYILVTAVAQSVSFATFHAALAFAESHPARDRRDRRRGGRHAFLLYRPALLHLFSGKDGRASPQTSSEGLNAHLRPNPPTSSSSAPAPRA